MVDQLLVTSGFDTEILMGARYLRYLLLSSVETGAFPTRLSLVQPPLDVTIHPPEDYQRLYTPADGAAPLPPADARAFDTEILVDDASGADLRVRVIVDLRQRDTGQGLDGVFIDLFVTLRLETAMGADGIPRDARLRFEVIALALDPLLALAIAFAGTTEAEVLEGIKPEVDRTIDLGVVGAGQNLQTIAMQKLGASGDHPAALGVYLNLRLRRGPAPDAYLGARGNLTAARNFLPAGDDLAFGLPGSLYPKLGADAKFRMAEETSPGSGDYHYPLRENPSDRSSDQKGKIKDIDVRALPGNVLEIDVHGEFFVDFLPDPDFHFRFTVKPKIDGGLLTFSVDHDIDVDLLGALLVGLAVVGILFGLGATALAALIVLATQELIVEPIALGQVGDKADAAFDASFLDALPHRVTAERRRWDPLYTTAHQIVALLEGIQINDAGLAFSGRAALDKEPEPTTDPVIRDEGRDGGGAIVDLLYRVIDFDQAAAGFTPVFPGTDRLPFERVQGDAETNLVRLTLAQVRDRIGSRRLRKQIAYVPKKVFIREGQIRLLLCISETEIGEARDWALWEFRETTRARLLAEQGAALGAQLAPGLEAQLGRPPTPEELQAAIDARIGELVAEQEAAFVEGGLPAAHERAIDTLLRFDLDSPELIALEDDRVLFIRGYERIRMRRGGKVSEYYRDRPDSNPRDNLLSLPRYTPSKV